MTFDINVQPAEDRDKGAYTYTVAQVSEAASPVVAFGHAATPQFAHEQANEAATQWAAYLSRTDDPYLGTTRVIIDG